MNDSKSEQVEFDHEVKDDAGPPGKNSKHSHRSRSTKLKIDTRDILLLMVFVVVIVALVLGKISVQWGVTALLVAGGALGASQFFHRREGEE